jgi:hypothetical protein
MPETATENSARIREALERAIVWADVETDHLSDHDFKRRDEDLALGLGVLHKWREEEA